MSMFDTVRCHYSLPVPAVQDCVFQTKSFDAPFDEDYTLRADGTLWHTEYDIEDRSDPNATGLWRMVGMMTRVNLREVPFPFSGEIDFYTDYGRRRSNGMGSGWVVFRATVEQGTLRTLAVVEHEPSEEEKAQKRHEELDESMPVGAPGTSMPSRL